MELAEKNNISSVRNCYGCGVCAATCAKRLISVELNRDGFYEPRIADPSQCTGCGLCTEVCSFLHEDLAVSHKPIASWASWSNDESVRANCSSGGIGFEIGRQLIGRGYHAVGCRYNVKKQIAEHYIATTVGEYLDSIGSKYIQSYTAEAFSKIKRHEQKYLICGTPCQIDSFRRMIQKFKCEDNFVLMDFFCHCVPTMHAWTAYLKMLEPGLGEIQSVGWRNKSTGWHDSWAMSFEGSENSLISWRSKGDYFYRLFLGDVCMGPQCEKNCKYKYDKSSADIRIGDMWGDTFKHDEKGVSALIAFTEKGYEIVNSLGGVTLVKYPFATVAEGQMIENARHREISHLMMFALRHGVKLDGIIFKMLEIAQIVIYKFKSFLR